jgi:hypothetical protein
VGPGRNLVILRETPRVLLVKSSTTSPWRDRDQNEITLNSMNTRTEQILDRAVVRLLTMRQRLRESYAALDRAREVLAHHPDRPAMHRTCADDERAGAPHAVSRSHEN